MKLYQIKKKKKISPEHCYQLCIWLKWEFSLLYLLLLLLFSLKTLLTYYWSNSSPRLFTLPPFFFFFCGRITCGALVGRMVGIKQKMGRT